MPVGRSRPGSPRAGPEREALPDIATPTFRYKAHTSIDRRYRLIRCWDVTDASRRDGRLLRQGLLDPTNTGAGVWADTAYRSQQNETFLERHGFITHIHHRRSPGRPLPAHIRRGNATRSRDRAPVEHVFAVQKQAMRLGSEPSISPEPARRSAWPTSPSTSVAWSNFGAASPLDQPTVGSVCPASGFRRWSARLRSGWNREPGRRTELSSASGYGPSVFRLWSGSQCQGAGRARYLLPPKPATLLPTDRHPKRPEHPLAHQSARTHPGPFLHHLPGHDRRAW